jgi:hypothetical protein
MMRMPRSFQVFASTRQYVCIRCLRLQWPSWFINKGHLRKKKNMEASYVWQKSAKKAGVCLFYCVFLVFLFLQGELKTAIKTEIMSKISYNFVLPFPPTFFYYVLRRFSAWRVQVQKHHQAAGIPGEKSRKVRVGSGGLGFTTSYYGMCNKITCISRNQIQRPHLRLARQCPSPGLSIMV